MSCRKPPWSPFRICVYFLTVIYFRSANYFVVMCHLLVEDQIRFAKIDAILVTLQKFQVQHHLVWLQFVISCIRPSCAVCAWCANLSWGDSRPYAVLQRTLDEDCRQAEEPKQLAGKASWFHLGRQHQHSAVICSGALVFSSRVLHPSLVTLCSQVRSMCS